MNETQDKIRREFLRYLFDDFLDGFPDAISDSKEAEDFEQGLKDKVCEMLGHDVIEDHCGLPDHDYCWVCMKPFPNEAKRD